MLDNNEQDDNSEEHTGVSMKRTAADDLQHEENRRAGECEGRHVKEESTAGTIRYLLTLTLSLGMGFQASARHLRASWRPKL
jgi:hypothetical protein